MSRRARFIGSVALAAIAFATWRFMSSPAEVSSGVGPEPVPESMNAASRSVNSSNAAVAVDPGRPVHSPPGNLATPQPTGRLDDLSPLTEQTLVGTKWERDGFRVEFGAAGKLLIGGRERAKWHVEGHRIRLYREETGEEHWLDIARNKLLWNSQELARTP